MTTNAIPKAGWRIREWHEAVGVSRSKTYTLITDEKIPSVRSGGSRIITISPHDYLAGLASPAKKEDAPEPSKTV